ncbi:hypothetical protein LXL04_003384 [Taraxacum kok-saghyz]
MVMVFEIVEMVFDTVVTVFDIVVTVFDIVVTVTDTAVFDTVVEVNVVVAVFDTVVVVTDTVVTDTAVFDTVFATMLETFVVVRIKCRDESLLLRRIKTRDPLLPRDSVCPFPKSLKKSNKAAACAGHWFLPLEAFAAAFHHSVVDASGKLGTWRSRWSFATHSVQSNTQKPKLKKMMRRIEGSRTGASDDAYRVVLDEEPLKANDIAGNINIDEEFVRNFDILDEFGVEESIQ